jgi:hypothetical protein
MMRSIAETRTKKTSKLHQKRLKKKLESTISLEIYCNEGYICKLLKRKGKLGLYEQLTDVLKPVAYELIIIQANKRKEYAPKTEDWGRLGWSFTKIENALVVFDKMSEHF